jgi:hypothetical protein
MAVANPKSQSPNPKEIPSPKNPNPNEIPNGAEIGISLGFGIWDLGSFWDLGFGIWDF